MNFILGGNDEKRYPGFNGQFYRPVFSQIKGAYIDKIEEVTDFLKDQGKIPVTEWNRVVTNKIVNLPLDRTED